MSDFPMDFKNISVVFRYLAIPLAQLHMLNRHPASRYDVTNATKSFDIPDVNAEALVDEERADCEEYLEVLRKWKRSLAL